MLIANRYEGTGNAAWGGMSEVHELIDLHLDREVVIKRMSQTADSSRLVDEQKALLTLRAKHVVELLDIVQYEFMGRQETGLVLEKIVGNDLQEGEFSSYDNAYLKTLWQIASGLADIHAAGVIHRDIKPGNVRRDHMGVIKIFDFGLSRQTGVDNKTRSIAGTDGYMAPELFGDRTLAFTNAIDVYAFGQTALSLIDSDSSSTTDIGQRCDNTLSQASSEMRGMVKRCFAPVPVDRPTMESIRDLVSSRLLYNQHRASFHNPPNLYQLNDAKLSISLKTNSGSISIGYDGYRMTVSGVSGNVSINNQRLSVGDEIVHSGVIIFRPDGNGYPAFVPYDLSNPQVAI